MIDLDKLDTSIRAWAFAGFVGGLLVTWVI